MASSTASEIWSASLSGCPSVTDSEVNRYLCAMSAGVYRPPPPPPARNEEELGAFGQELRDAVEDRAGELGLGPGSQRLVVAGRRQDHRVVGLAAESGPRATDLVDHDEVEAFGLELATGGGLEVLGLGRKADQDAPALGTAEFGQDVGRRDQLEPRGARILLQLLAGDIGRSPVGHRGGLHHRV